MVSRLKDEFRFSWSDSLIPYLEVNLAARIDLLYAANDHPLLQKIKAELI